MKLCTDTQEHVRNHQKKPHLQDDGNTLKFIMADTTLEIKKSNDILIDFHEIFHNTKALINLTL